MLDLLARRGELGNTYIVFTTGNGTAMGHHRWYHERGAKQVPYEEAAGVPLTVRGPGVLQGVVKPALVANNDIPVTFTDWANAESLLEAADGRSLAPVLTGAAGSWRTALLNEKHQAPIEGANILNYNALISSRYT